MQKQIFVFCGDTVSSKHIQETFPDSMSRITILPPAGQGDVWRNIRQDVSAIVLIDCKQQGEACVWQREIMDALRVHIRVVGAGRLGAVRAKELAQFGMEGVGQFFESLEDERNDYRALNEVSAEVAHRDAMAAIRYALHITKDFDQPACGTFASSLTEHRWRRNALNLRPCVINGHIVRGSEIIHHFLQFSSPEALAEISTKMYATFYTLEWAKQTGTTCPHEVRTAIFEREAAYLGNENWLLSNGLLQCEYATLLDQEALLHHLSSSPWHTYVEAWANKAGIIVPDTAHTASAYEWIITKNPAFFGYIWEYEVGLWDWLQRNKRVSDIAQKVIALQQPS